MTHDPLCPRFIHHKFCEGCTPQCGTCQCNLIAKVVKREQEKAAERIAAIEPTGEPFDGGYHDGYRDALDHAEQAVTA
jgi:hypothetical protein